MSQLIYLVSFLLALNRCGKPAYGRLLSDEENLMHTLFKRYKYNPSARPVSNSSQAVLVKMQFSLMHIKELDVRSQVLTTTGLLIMEWEDERLTWNSTEHGVKEIVVEAGKLWRPEFAVINGADSIHEDFKQFRAMITCDGNVRWEPGGVFKTRCEVDITYYPFDEQRCKLIFGAWSYHTAKMNLTNSSATVNLDSYNTNGEWAIYRTLTNRSEFFYGCCPNERFSNVVFEIFMKRRHTFYVMNVILPSIMTSVLLLSIFFCTPGQKVQIGVVVLLSFRIFLLNVSDSIPKTSDHTPILGIYLTCTMAITTLSMVLTVFVLNLHFMTDKPVPSWARQIVLYHLAPILTCSERPKRNTEKTPLVLENPHATKCHLAAVEKLKEVATASGSECEKYAEVEIKNSIVELTNGSLSKTKTCVAPPGLLASGEVSPVSESGNIEDMPPCPKPAKPEKPDYSKDWKRMAEVLDRLFFWLFLLAIVISTLLLFHPVIGETSRRSEKIPH